MKSKRRTRGVTMVEVTVAASIGVMVLFGAVMTLVFGMTSWVQGESRIVAESDAQSGIRAISQRLREAMAVSVDANGKGLAYRLPKKDDGGNYLVPAIWDGVSRRIEFSNGDIDLVDGDVRRTICEGVVLTDPLSNGGTGTYPIFRAGSGSITRQVTVQIVRQTNGSRNKTITSRRLETIYLRNIPELRN
ncbi:MAG: hypothetical protein U0S12_07375 [Fimbriimonadales bacterium]